MANFEAFHWNISSSTNPEFGRSDTPESVVGGGGNIFSSMYYYLWLGKAPLHHSITLNTTTYIGSCRMYCIAKQVFIAGKQIDYPSFLLLRWFSKYFDVLFSGAMSTS